MSDCAGCTALAGEVAFLRGQVEKLQDRLLGAPVAAPAPVAAQAEEPPLDPDLIVRGEDQQMYYQVNGRKVLLETYLQARREGGGIDESGQYVPPAEWQKGMNKLNEMLAGG